VVNEIAAEEQHIGFRGQDPKQRVQALGAGSAAMEIADRRDAHGITDPAPRLDPPVYHVRGARRCICRGHRRLLTISVAIAPDRTIFDSASFRPVKFCLRSYKTPGTGVEIRPTEISLLKNSATRASRHHDFFFAVAIASDRSVAAQTA
jgi:hypothetical protein